MSMMMVGSPLPASALSDVLMGLSLSRATAGGGSGDHGGKLGGESGLGAGRGLGAGSDGGPPPSSALQIDLGCLLPAEARGLSITSATGGTKAKASGGGGGNSESKQGKVSTSARGGGAAVGAQGDLSSISNQMPPTSTGGSTHQQDLGGHYGRIRQELGKGEGVTALLERASRRAGPVTATEDDGGGGILSDDEGVGMSRPMSPTTRLRRDTFGATLDFIEALCDASSSLASFTQVREQGVGKGWMWKGNESSMCDTSNLHDFEMYDPFCPSSSFFSDHSHSAC